MERVALVIVPIATAVVFIVVLAMETVEVRYDLQLITPPSVAPGARMPARAFFFVPTDGPGPDRAEARPAVLTLYDEDGAVAAEGDLVVAAPDVRGLSDPGRYGMAGWLTAPDAEGVYTVRASIREDGETIARCDAPLVVRDSPRASPLAARPMMPMQQWRLSSIETSGRAPSALELRVRAGFCVPDLPCELLVWVGEPAAVVTLEGHGVEIEGAEGEEPVAGILRRSGTVRGPEASVTLVAARDGTQVARRSVQLPIVQSGVWVEEGPAICEAPCERRIESAHEEPVLVDLFRDGVWSDVSTIPMDGRDVFAFAFALEPGVWRAQFRTDPFGVESASSHVIYVGSEGGAVAAIKARLVMQGADDAFTMALPLDDVPAEEQAAFAATLLEMDIVPLPQARSGRVQEDLGLGQDRSTARWIAALFVLAVGLLVAGWVMRRGLVASAEARAVMAEAGDEAATSRRNVLSMTLTVGGVVFATLLAFAAAALLLLTRGV
jgi:hypothetical protein